LFNDLSIGSDNSLDFNSSIVWLILNQVVALCLRFWHLFWFQSFLHAVSIWLKLDDKTFLESKSELSSFGHIDAVNEKI